MEQLEEDLEKSRLFDRDPGTWLINELGPIDTQRLATAVSYGVPTHAFAVLARWWQLETYLRLLVYTELKGVHGTHWAEAFDKGTHKRHERSEDNQYMASADDDHLLAYADVSALSSVIDSDWTRLSTGIGMPQAVWAGKWAEITSIRHRLAHLRRPHPDDVDRIEQVLRDLDPAANRFLRAYTTWIVPDSEVDDPVVAAWLREEHPVAQRLVSHGRQNKGINFNLGWSRLPWAETSDVITGTPGYFWNLYVTIRRGQVDLRRYTNHFAVRRWMPEISHIYQPFDSSVVVSIPAVLDPQAVADIIGDLFEAVFETWSGAVRPRTGRLDPRVQQSHEVLSILSNLDPEDGMTVFGA
jgi:hypothetical protein